MTKGKNYANRKPVEKRPAGDFYETPTCMIEELLFTPINNDECNDFFNEYFGNTILDPCCGKNRIGNTLRKYGWERVTERDIMYGDDFIKKDKSGNIIIGDEHYDAVIMNPPFKSFNDFVYKSKLIADRVYCIGKMNFFGAHDRNLNGLWEHLEWVLPFDRQIAFDIPEHEDGKVEMGMMVTGWFIWNKNYNGHPKIQVIDMQKYAYHKTKDKK